MYNYQKLQVLRAKAKQSAGKDEEKKPSRAAEAALEPEKQALLPDDKVAVQAYTNFRYGTAADDPVETQVAGVSRACCSQVKG